MQNAIAKIKVICDASEGRSQFFPFGTEGYIHVELLIYSQPTMYFTPQVEVATKPALLTTSIAARRYQLALSSLDQPRICSRL